MRRDRICEICVICGFSSFRQKSLRVLCASAVNLFV